ncbi:MAG: pyridoxal 5'-phosphate synthase glutaminase subunit PdxT [Pseudomonadota bacterium]
MGILALQGAYAAHVRPLVALGHRPFEVRSPGDLDAAEGLVLPGGESSVHLALLARFGMEEPLRAWARAGGKPVLATCAGVILAAGQVAAPAQRSFGLLDIAVARNAYGRQRHSFQAVADDGELPLLFIRAPRITRVGAAVEVLATFQGEAILVRQGAITGATFHPELSGDDRVHSAVFGNVEA